MAINVNDRIDNPAEADVEHYVGLEHLDSDSLKIRRWGAPSEVEATKLRFRKGDIIFGRRRAYQRKLAVAEFDGICSAHAMVLRPKTEVVLPEFLPFFMQSDLFMNRALEISVGSLSPTINWKTLASQEFALPPMEQQRRVAMILTTAREPLEALQIAIQELITLRDALIKQRSAELSENGLTQLRTIIAKIESGTSPGGSGRPAQDDEFGVLKVSAVGHWDFHAEENKIIQNFEFYRELEVRAGDLLATRANADPASVGRTCLVNDTRPGLMLSDKTWRLNLAPNKNYNKIGILAWTKSATFRRHIQKSLGGTDAKNISQKAFLDGPFPLCSEDAFNTFSSEVESILMSEKLLYSRFQQTQNFARQLAQQSFGDSHG